jgi:hypothetical protein
MQTFSCRYYVYGLLIAPAIFYLPKFFEIRAITTTKVFEQVIKCDEFSDESNCYPALDDTNNSTRMMETIIKEFNMTELQFSWLRKDWYYRQVSTILPALAYIKLADHAIFKMVRYVLLQCGLTIY